MSTSRHVPALLSPTQVATALGISRDTLDRHLDLYKAHGLLEANRVGRRRFFAASSVETVLWRRRVGGLRLTRVAS
jgi:DNA-binding transcriptional ArsR family regulator